MESTPSISTRAGRTPKPVNFFHIEDYVFDEQSMLSEEDEDIEG